MRWSCAVAVCWLLMLVPARAQQGSAADTAKTKPRPHKSADANAATAPAAQQQQPAPAAKPDAAADNPFPEDVSRGAAAKAASADSPDAPAAGEGAGSSGSSSSGSGGSPDSSSSSSSSSSPSNSGGAPGGSASGADPNAEPDVPDQGGRRRLRKPSDKDIRTGSLAGEGRAAEDVRVGRYYLSQHNYQGAYARFAEAARLDQANVEAIYGVAASAEGLHKNDEALENYKLYLQIAPDGEHARLAEKSLKSLSK